MYLSLALDKQGSISVDADISAPRVPGCLLCFPVSQLEPQRLWKKRAGKAVRKYHDFGGLWWDKALSFMSYMEG